MHYNESKRNKEEERQKNVVDEMNQCCNIELDDTRSIVVRLVYL